MREGHENSWRGHNHDRKKEEMHTPPKGGKGENAGKKTDFGRCIFSLPPPPPPPPGGGRAGAGRAGAPPGRRHKKKTTPPPLNLTLTSP